jgi:hypothetical protein
MALRLGHGLGLDRHQGVLLGGIPQDAILSESGTALQTESGDTLLIE